MSLAEKSNRRRTCQLMTVSLSPNESFSFALTDFAQAHGLPVFIVSQAGDPKTSSTGSIFPPSSLDALCSSQGPSFLPVEIDHRFPSFSPERFLPAGMVVILPFLQLPWPKQSQAQAGSHQIVSVDTYRLPARYPPNIVA